jgi:anti-sigma factor RsiW
MECSEPGAIRDEELVACLEGEKVRPAVVQHLAACQRCSSQLAAYRRMELKLTSKLYRWDCPPSQLLGEYQLGLLNNELASKVRMHLSTCVRCTAEMATLTQFLANDSTLVELAAVAQKNVSVRPSSPNNHHPVQDVKQTLDHLREQSLAGVRRIVATLLPAQPRLAYQRDVSQQVALWPRRYSAEDVNISIQVERDSSHRGSLQLIGLVTRKSTTLEALQGTPVQLSSQTSTVYTQKIDELGNFVFSSIAPATYTLELQFPESIIVVDQLVLSTQD